MTHDTYYYAGGERIPLALDERRVCVDLSRVKARAAGVRAWLKRSRGHPLKRGLALFERSAIPPGVLRALDREGALLPVFRHGKALIVVLPEVRVETRGRQQARLRSLVRRGSLAAEIERDEADRMVLRPVSGRGEDALALANVVYEKLRPLAAQARFVRLLPRPVDSGRA